MGITAKGKKNAGLLTEGSIAKGILAFAIPLFLGQLLQQFYNVADAWVVGNFADNDSFAAVSSAGSLTFLIIGFFNGIAIGGGVVISKYTGHGGKYDTSDASAEYMGKVRALLEKNNVMWQVGELGKVDMGGGGTIAKYVANMNVDVVDLGGPVLSMHAPFEIVSKTDVYMAYRAFFTFFDTKD